MNGLICTVNVVLKSVGLEFLSDISVFFDFRTNRKPEGDRGPPHSDLQWRRRLHKCGQFSKWLFPRQFNVVSFNLFTKLSLYSFIQRLHKLCSWKMMFRTIYFIKNFYKDEHVYNKMNWNKTDTSYCSLLDWNVTFIGLNMVCDCQTYISLSEWLDGIWQYGRRFAYLFQHFIFI